jgi:hypothetical protein
MDAPEPTADDPQANSQRDGHSHGDSHSKGDSHPEGGSHPEGETRPNGTGEPGPASEDFESDAMRLLAYSADAVGEDSGYGSAEDPAFSIRPSQFNESGTPQMLHVGRDEDGEVVWEVWGGRTAVKKRIKSKSVPLYKRLRKLLMSYEMGEEIPVCTLGRDGNLGIALLTLEEQPQIKSP